MADPTRPYELTFDAREHYLYVHIHADAITRETVLAYLTEIAEECARLEYRRLMIHREVPEKPAWQKAIATNSSLIPPKC